VFWAVITSTIKDRRRAAEFEQAMSEHGAALARVARAYTPDGALRRDLEQEIALGVWRALPNWSGDASLRTYLFRVAHNRCIDAIRRQRPHEPFTEDQHAHRADTEARVTARDSLEQVARHIRALPLSQAQAFTLMLEGLPHAEIAEVMGTSTSNVGVLIHRARASIKDAMEER